MKAWELRDAQGTLVRRIRGPRRFAEQFLAAGLHLVEVDEGDTGGPPARPPDRAPRLLAKRGSLAAQAKRARLRAKLEAQPQQFIRAAIAALIDAGALDGMGE